MIVTDITDFSKKQCKIRIDDAFAFVLYKGELQLYGIKKGKAIDQTTYDKLVGEVLTKRAKLRAMNLLKSRAYTEKRLREKLEAGKYPAVCVEQAMAYVKGYGYVDDERYAADFLFYHGKDYNQFQIFQKLKQKGIVEETIKKAYEEYREGGEAPDEETLIKRYLDKKHYMPQEPSEADLGRRNQIIRALMRKGFGYDRILAVLHSYGKNDEEIVNFRDGIG